jgi:hypothetical protein
MARDEVIGYLTEDESLRLAATAPVGRVVYSRYAMPAVHLVNFRLDGHDAVFKPRKGSKNPAARRRRRSKPARVNRWPICSPICAARGTACRNARPHGG